MDAARAGMGAGLGARWFWYSLLTVAGWAGWALLLKLGSLQIPDAPALFLQTLGMLPLALLLLATGSVRGPQDRRGVIYSLLNGSITGIGILFLLAAYRTGGNTAVVSVTTALYPLVTCALAFGLLRERLTNRQWLGLFLSVVAIVMFAWPAPAAGYSAAAPRLFAPWLLYTMLALACFGIVGFLQKVSTDRVSAESALVWLSVGFVLLLPFIYTGPSMFHYPARSMAFVVAGGLFVLAKLQNKSAGLVSREALPARAASRSWRGGPCHNKPEMTTFVSSTIRMANSPFRASGLDLGQAFGVG